MLHFNYKIEKLHQSGKLRKSAHFSACQLLMLLLLKLLLLLVLLLSISSLIRIHLLSAEKSDMQMSVGESVCLDKEGDV